MYVGWMDKLTDAVGCMNACGRSDWGFAVAIIGC